MKPIKIIHISGFLNYKPPHHAQQNTDLFFVSSWAGLFARRLKKYAPELNIESWRAENEISEITIKEVFQITGVIWPYKKAVIKNLLTLGMIKRLNKLKENYTVILHHHDLFNIRFVLIVNFLCPRIKIVLTHHGGVLPKKGSLKFYIMKVFYSKSFISYITYLSPTTKTFLESILGHPPLSFLPVGADYNIFQPMDKELLRIELGLVPDKIYGIYVGYFYRLKSVDLILDSVKVLKSKYNFDVIFVGGLNSTSNDLFDEVVASGSPWFGVTPWSEMVKYYNAADFYIHPAFNASFGGLDVSWIEALACNRPVLSPQLGYLDFDNSDLGVVIKDRNELIEKTDWIINNYKLFTNCREASRKHLDANKAIMEKLVRIYTEIGS